MASTSGPLPRTCLVRTETASLDPVGVCLALEGRLSSAEGREGLTGALRRASRSGDLLSRVAAAEQAASSGVHASNDAVAPRCLSSQAHQLPAELLDAFQVGAAEQPSAAAAAAADVTSPAGDAPSSSRQRGSRTSSGGLVQQDSLVHHPRGSSMPLVASNRSSGGGAAAGLASSPPQRPPVSTAIERTSTATLDANGGVDHGAGVHDPSCTCPPYAVKSTCGKRPNMEDTYALCPNICELPMSPMAHEYADKLPQRIAVQFENHCMYLPTPDSNTQQQQQQQQPPGTAADASAVGGVPGGAAVQEVQHQMQQLHMHSPAQGQGFSRPQQQPQQAHLQQTEPQQQQQVNAVAPAPPSEDTAAVFAGAANLQPTPLAAAPDAENSVSSISSGSDGGSVEKLHFFGVYDGHGGIEASQHCAQRLHYHLSKAVAEMASVWLESSAGDEAAGNWNPESRYIPLDTVRLGEGEGSPGECTLTSSNSVDESAAADGSPSASTSSAGAVASSDRELGRSISANSTANSGGQQQDCEVDSNEGSAEGSEGTMTSFCGMMEEVLRDAFLKTDEEFSNSGLQAGLVGSTAVVALVGTHRVWIANCGDSRAVLSRAGVAIQVTDDHKPEREDEAERVEKAGGQVLYWNGHRVMGVLAMSRAIGDHCLRPYVIPEPEISVFARHPSDEILLLATDGLWDVLKNHEATDLALRSIKRAREKGASRKAAARVAATVLTKAAVDRGSRDNITVVIIDLSPPASNAERGEQSRAGSTANGPLPQEGHARRQSATDAAGGANSSSGGAGAAAGNSGASGRPSSGGSGRLTGRPGSGRTAAGASNPFAAAAASPFSTAATGSSELPLPSGASGSAASGSGSEALAAAAAAAAIERSNRSSASSGRLRNSATGAASGSVFAAAGSVPASISGSEVSAGSPARHRRTISKELDSIDLSGSAAFNGGLHTIDSMAAASSAAEGSTTSSTLEEQPTIVEPPPCLTRQASSSPFSAFAAPFDAADTA